MDDDLDEAIDEGFAVGTRCTVGRGACAVDGVTVCAPDGAGIECGTTPGPPRGELCNGLDDDCSGVVDEGFVDVGEPCTVGHGACERAGQRVCAPDGRGTTCNALPDETQSTVERCNGIDDDCDATTDEGLRRSCAVDGEAGACVAGSQLCEGGAWSACESLVDPEAVPRDACNGLDDDCDFSIDENDLPDGAFPCDVEGECPPRVEGCVPVTRCVEQCRPDGGIGFVCAPAPEFLCDGVDDDCDGAIDDDGICSERISETCSLTFGWTSEPLNSPAAEWAGCNPDAGGIDDTYSCNRTRGARFSTVGLPAGVDLDGMDDRIGLALRCGDGAVGDYVARACRVVIGVATAEAGIADGDVAWGACPGQRVGGDGASACTSSAEDGAFLPLPLPFDLTAERLMGVAFICADPEDPARAAAMQASVSVGFAWADSRVEIVDDAQWEMACAPLGDGEPFSAGATTRGDGRFRLFRLTADVDGGDRFAIRLAPWPG